MHATKDTSDDPICWKTASHCPYFPEDNPVRRALLTRLLALIDRYRASPLQFDVHELFADVFGLSRALFAIDSGLLCECNQPARCALADEQNRLHERIAEECFELSLAASMPPKRLDSLLSEIEAYLQRHSRPAADRS